MIVQINHTCGHVSSQSLGVKIADRAKKRAEQENKACYDCSKKTNLQIELFDRKDRN